MLAGDLAGSHDPSSQMHINKGCFFGFCFGVFFFKLIQLGATIAKPVEWEERGRSGGRMHREDKGGRGKGRDGNDGASAQLRLAG